MVHKTKYLEGAGVVTVDSVVGTAAVGDGIGRLQLEVWSMKNLSQPLTSQSCRKRSMPSEHRSAVEHQTHSNPMLFVMHVSQEFRATHVGKAVK